MIFSDGDTSLADFHYDYLAFVIVAAGALLICALLSFGIYTGVRVADKLNIVYNYGKYAIEWSVLLNHGLYGKEWGTL